MIREFRVEDASACSQLIRSCIEIDRQIAARAREVLLYSETPQAMLERARLFYVVVFESEGAPLGMAGLDMNEIRILQVSPECRGRGIGRALLKHLEAMVPPALFRDVFVYASVSAAGFYRAHGYHPGGEHCFALGRELLRTLFMTKPTIMEWGHRLDACHTRRPGAAAAAGERC